MKALVTGCAGFVGTRLSAHLEAQGDTVIGIDRETCRTKYGWYPNVCIMTVR